MIIIISVRTKRLSMEWVVASAQRIRLDLEQGFFSPSLARGGGALVAEQCVFVVFLGTRESSFPFLLFCPKLH